MTWFLYIFFMSIAIALFMKLGQTIHDECKFSKRLIVFILTLLFFCPASYFHQKIAYDEGLVDGAREQLRGNTEVTINNSDTTIVVNKKFVDLK